MNVARCVKVHFGVRVKLQAREHLGARTASHIPSDRLSIVPSCEKTVSIHAEHRLGGGDAARVHSRALRLSAAGKPGRRSAVRLSTHTRAASVSTLSRELVPSVCVCVCARVCLVLSCLVERERRVARATTRFVFSGRYEVNWNLVPRPIEVRVHTLRAVKDKL